MINVVDTPNPDTKKFVFDQTIVKIGSKEFKKSDQSNIDLVNDLFLIKELELVYLDKNFISIDTEFVRNKTFYPQLCLLQIGTSTGSYAIDPNKISNLPLLK